jgi:hypothetical protein
MRKLTVVLVLTLVVLGVPAVAASASPLPDLVCGMTITTSVRLRHDLTCPTGFELDHGGVTTQTITIDLGGHTLDVPPSGRVGCAFGDPHGTCTIANLAGTNLTVIDGTVLGDVGLSAFDNPPPGNTLVSRVHVEGDTWLVYDGGEISDSRIDGQVHALATTSIVRRDVILGGIVILDTISSPNLTITDNLIANSPGDGIGLNAYSFSEPDVSGTISRNVIYRSSGAGIGGVGSDLDNLRIANNWLVDNAGDGVSIAADGPSPSEGSATIAGNIATLNGGHGLDIAGLGAIIDGGHNRALGNALDPQCIGVAC